MLKKHLKYCRRYQKLILIFIGLSVLSVVDTMKGYIISDCGYSTSFWVMEIISLLVSIVLLSYLWNNILEGSCFTKKNKITETKNNK